MAINYNNPVTATANNKSVHVKSIKLTFADITTGGANSVKAILPAQATILGFLFQKKTAFSGGGITAATLSIGITGAPTSFVNDVVIHLPGDVALPAGAQSFLTSAGTHAGYQLPAGGDISLLFTGTATTGNPTAGEIYVDILYVE